MTDATAAMASLTCDMSEYQDRLLHAKHSHEEYRKALAIGALLFFAAGLAAVHLELATGAVALLAIAGAFWHMASHRQLLADMTDSQWSLALLMNRQATDREVGR